MTYCFNPSCARPNNPDQAKFCHYCGSSLLLAHRFRALRPLGDSSRAFIVIDQHLPSRPKAVAIRLDIDCVPSDQALAEPLQQLEILSSHSSLPKLLACVEWDIVNTSAMNSRVVTSPTGAPVPSQPLPTSPPQRPTPHFLVREWVEGDSFQVSTLPETPEALLDVLTQLLELRSSLDQASSPLQLSHLLGSLTEAGMVRRSAQSDKPEGTHRFEYVWVGNGERSETTDLFQIGKLAIRLLTRPRENTELLSSQSEADLLEQLNAWEKNTSEPFHHEWADALRPLIQTDQSQNAADILTTFAALRRAIQEDLLKKNGSIAVETPSATLAMPLESGHRACVLESLIAPDFSSDIVPTPADVSSETHQALQEGDFAQVTTSSLVATLLTHPVEIPLGKLIQKAAQTHPSSEPYIPQKMWEQLIQLQAQGGEPEQLGPRWLELGEFYQEQIQQSSRNLVTLVLAIASYEQAQACIAAGFEFPVESYDALGRLYWHLSRQHPSKRSRCLHCAVKVYQQGLQQLSALTTSASVPPGATDSPAHESLLAAQLWVELYHHLGEAYGDLAQVDQSPEHGRQAIEAFESALAVESPAERLAMIQNNLGTACWNLAQSEQGEAAITLFQKAIAAYNIAADQYDPDEEPLRYGMVQNNLGTAYLNLGQLEQSIDVLRLAVGTYQVALMYRSRDAAPLSHAATQNNLGAACIQLASHPYLDPEGVREALEKAIAAYQEALMLVRELKLVGLNRFGFDPDTSRLNLGLAYQRLGMAAPSDASQTFTVHLETAIQSYLEVLEQQPKESTLYNSALDYLNQSIHYLSDEMGFPQDHPALQSLPDHLYVEMSQRLQQQLTLEAAAS